MFWFGRNWKNYVKVLNEKVIEEAKNSLLRYVPNGFNASEFYKDKVFIDVGCGSGLFSLAALLSGCKDVISFDIQYESLEATIYLKEKFSHLLPKDKRWRIFIGDILDDNLVKKLQESGDIVYSWGVLHHTGKMYKAIENVCKLVKKDGFLIIAIYNHARSSKDWERIKKFYNKYTILQPLLGLFYGTYVSLGYMVRRRTFNLYRERGMHVFYDGIDWIGGYPYEYACFEEIKNYVENLGFSLVNAPTKLPCEKEFKYSSYLHKIWGILRSANTGCNEFVFKKCVE